MRFWCAVLIAAVTVNCLVTAINGKTTANTAVEPFNMLLPPLEDKPEDAVKTTKAPSAATAHRTTTTAKPLPNKVNNVLPELSIEALLPPLYEAKIEKAEKEHKQQQTQHTTTKAPTTTTTARTTTTTTTTARTTTPQPPLIEALLPPLEDEGSAASAATVAKTKTTKKSYYQQQQTQHLVASATQSQSKATKLSKDKQQKPFAASKNVADTKNPSKPLTQHVIGNIQQLATQHVAKQVAQRKQIPNTNLHGLDLYLGYTTPRPPKQGLPTITPFPHRLRR